MKYVTTDFTFLCTNEQNKSLQSLLLSSEGAGENIFKIITQIWKYKLLYEVRGLHCKKWAICVEMYPQSGRKIMFFTKKNIAFNHLHPCWTVFDTVISLLSGAIAPPINSFPSSAKVIHCVHFSHPKDENGAQQLTESRRTKWARRTRLHGWTFRKQMTPTHLRCLFFSIPQAWLKTIGRK